MGVDGMNSADIFDEYFDDEKPKYIIRNCPAFDEGDCASPTEHIPYATACEHIEDCKLKQIVEKCSKAHGQIIGYEKGKIYDGKNLIEANLPLTTINPLGKEILELLDIEEVE